MELTSLKHLDRPTFTQPLRNLLSFEPFYNDSVSVIYIKKQFTPQPHFCIVRIVDKELIEYYDIANVFPLIKVCWKNVSVKLTSDFFIRYVILELYNGKWCVYIQKTHTFDSFFARTTTILTSYSQDAVMTFLNKYVVHPKKTSKFSIRSLQGF